MAVVRDVEPWDELLAAGREDERLVMQAAQNRRPARAVALPEELHPDVADALRALGVKRARPAIYDGDTPREQRAQLRRRANVILTNPDMLHLGILPNHRAWADVFANLALVVIDEAHVYRGVFGSHVANVLRRLRRVASAYGTTPRFVLTSATIANPLTLAQALTGLDFRLIDEDGAPRGSREILMCNPPLLDERTGRRASSLSEAAELFADLVASDTRAICFARSRRGAELIYQFARRRLNEASPHASNGNADRIAPYRAGYTPQQ